MKDYIARLIIDSEDDYATTANLKVDFYSAWSKNQADYLEKFDLFFDEFCRTVYHLNEKSDRLRTMTLYIICQLEGVLISKGFNENQLSMDLLAYFYRIDTSDTISEILASLKETCLYLIDYEKKAINVKTLSPIIRKTIAYIDEHIYEKLTLEKIADSFNYSTSHLSHKFKAEMNDSFSHYLSHIKLEKAKELLSQNYSLDDVAHTLAFSSTSHFIASFKKETNITPKQFIKWLNK